MFFLFISSFFDLKIVPFIGDVVILLFIILKNLSGEVDIKYLSSIFAKTPYSIELE